MRYVISDIHGCYEEYRELLEKLYLTNNDTLYILGDSVDRGPEPIKIMQDLMSRKNVKYIIGNHDFLFLYFMDKLMNDLSGTEKFSSEDIVDFKMYLEDGGAVTVEQFMKLSMDDRKSICTYIKKASAYEVIEEEDIKYILVHAGISDFNEQKEMKEYHVLDLICDRIDYERRYFQNENIHIITGHTPTMYISPNSSGAVLKKNGHIAIDCGCVYGGRLAAYCIETADVKYVEAKARYCR